MHSLCTGMYYEKTINKIIHPGYVCGGSGGYKGTHTGFYNSGKLRSFFPPEDVMVDGVPCEETPFVNVNLYENGKLKSCKLADDYQADGNTYKNGTILELDALD